MNKFFAYFLSLLSFLFFFTSNSYAQLNYSIVDSDPNTPGISFYSASNNIVRDSAGNIYVAYGLSTNQATHGYCFVRKSSDGGATWGNAIRMDTFPDSSSVYSLAVDSKDNLLAGLTFNVGSYFTKSVDSGKTWSSAIELLDGGWGTWDWLPSIAIDSADSIHAAFHAQFGWQSPPANLFYTFSLDGTSFQSPEDITKIPNDPKYGIGAGPANLQVGKNNELFVMTNIANTSDADSYSVLMHQSNNAWLEAIKLNDENTFGAGGDFVIDSSGKLHIFLAQIDSTANNRRISYKTYDPVIKQLTNLGTITDSDINVQNISAGIYENDEIIVAYDIYDTNSKQYQGVYVKKSNDNFSRPYEISKTTGARSPNLRSYFYNMHQKNKQDIIWVEPDTSAGGEMLVYYEISGGIKPSGKATIDVFVPYFMNPGQEATIVVRYSNSRGEDITNAAVVLDVPSDLLFIGASNGGIYKDREGSPQVFWKLETLKDGSKGSQFARFLIPWGMPSVKGNITANLIGENLFSNYDTTKYYAYESRDILSQSDLTEKEIDSILSSDKELNELLNYSIDLGYQWSKVGQNIKLSNQKEITTLFLLDPSDYSPLMIKRVSGLPVYAEQRQGTRYTKFDINGGYTTNSASDEFISFGKWAESHSLTEARCQVNCTLNKVPGWIGEAASKTYNMASTSLNCISCAKSKGKEIGDCANCLNSYKDIPGVSYGVDVAQCLKDCLENPDLHICTEDKKECSWSVIGLLAGEDTVITTLCNKTTGTYAIASYRTYCATNEKCKDGKCVESADDPCKQPSTIAPAQEGAVCKPDDFEIVPAHDPNAISVSPDGDILPDERLTYTIEYENTGAGTAYEVFIINQLDENLDEETLKINDNGTFSPYSRLLNWQIGTLDQGQKGSVSYSINPKKGLPVGTVISNFAEVHFPSAGEVTPTNIIASKISNLAADNLNVEMSIKETKIIKLSARGKEDVEFKILSYPRFGSIKLNLPDVEYTAPDNFIGTDRFTYYAIKGTNISDAATVSININGDDTNPPSIVNTYPQDNAENIKFSTTPFYNDTYLPEIWAQVDEDINKDTLNAYNITVEDNDTNVLSVNPSYDSMSRKIIIRPLMALEPSSEYKVTIKAIYDKNQNMLKEAYTFKFKTVAEKQLDIALSDFGEILDFGKIPVNTEAENKTVSLTSIGISAVNITKVTLSQSKDEFSIIEDKCSKKPLASNENCHITIGFSPKSTGAKSASLTIESNDDTNKSINITIKGEAIDSSAIDAGTDGALQDGNGTTTETKDEGSGCGCNYLE